MKSFRLSLFAALLGLVSLTASAQEAAIRKSLGERAPRLQKIDEITPTPMPGLFEVRVNGNEIFYTDAEGNFVIQGQIYDLREGRNLTADRLDKLNAIDFATLPFNDAFTIVHGNGKRKLAVFEDPNCGYCKRFERDLAKIEDITVYVFLFPILSADSAEKSRNIWCAKDRVKAWEDWMLNNKTPATLKCDTAAIVRNVELGRKHKITGTPTLIFADGLRVPGAVGVKEIEKRLAEAAR